MCYHSQSLDRTVHLMVEPFSSKSPVKECTVLSKLLEFTCCLHSPHIVSNTAVEKENRAGKRCRSIRSGNIRRWLEDVLSLCSASRKQSRLHVWQLSFIALKQLAYHKHYTQQRIWEAQVSTTFLPLVRSQCFI